MRGGVSVQVRPRWQPGNAREALVRWGSVAQGRSGRNWRSKL